MNTALRFLIVPLALFGAESVAAQGNSRAFEIQVFGGGASHLRNLNSDITAADFKPGYNLGFAFGVQADKYVAVHADLTYTRNEARGASPFAGTKIDRFFYGAHVELTYPSESRFAPFAFGGGGAVTVHQPGSAGTLATFTKPAAMFGGGFRYQFAGAPVELLAEGKSLVYKWDGAGFARTQWDLSYSVGLAYRLGF